MITEDQIFELASKLPFGAGREIAKRAGVSEAFVSLFLNGKLTNTSSKSCTKVIKECVYYIKRDKNSQQSVKELIESL